MAMPNIRSNDTNGKQCVSVQILRCTSNILDDDGQIHYKLLIKKSDFFAVSNVDGIYYINV